MSSSQQRTSARVSAAIYAVLALALCAALAAGTSLASTKIPPGIAGLPSQGKDHLRGPASLNDAEAEAQEQRVFRASVLQCHTWPDGTITQTADPRSPSCVSGWDEKAGNGGSTSPGVEGNVVRIGIPSVTVDTAGLEEYFNSRYEFYGRSIKLVPIGAVSTEPLQRAAMAEAAARKVFAVAAVDVKTDVFVPFDADGFLSGLAANKIIGVVDDDVVKDGTLMGNGPYAWSVSPTEEQRQRYQARFVCSSLKGRPARFSADFAERERSFAVLTPAATSRPSGVRMVDPTILTRALSQCGITAKAYEYTDLNSDPEQTARDVTMYRQLKADGVTTLIVAGGVEPVAMTLSGNAETAGYHPEFVGAVSKFVEWGTAPQSQKGAMLGVRFGPPPAADAEPPVMQAFLESGYERKQAETAMYAGGSTLFSVLGVIAAGIQAAGPDLTAESFAAGLESTKFPSPTNAETWGSGAVGFQLGDHTFERDAALQYYDPEHFASWTAPKNRVAAGRECLVHDGRRFSLDAPFPEDDAGFYDDTLDCDGPGTAGIDQPASTVVITPMPLPEPTDATAPAETPAASSPIPSSPTSSSPRPDSANPAPTATTPTPRGAR